MVSKFFLQWQRTFTSDRILCENLALKQPDSNSYCHSVMHLAHIKPAGCRYMPAV